MTTRDDVGWCGRCEDYYDYEYDVDEVINPKTNEGVAVSHCPSCGTEHQQFVLVFDPESEDEEWPETEHH